MSHMGIWSAGDRPAIGGPGRKRPITSSAAAAFSSRTVTLPRRRVETTRLPITSSISRIFADPAPGAELVPPGCAALPRGLPRNIVDPGRGNRH